MNPQEEMQLGECISEVRACGYKGAPCYPSLTGGFRNSCESWLFLLVAVTGGMLVLARSKTEGSALAVPQGCGDAARSRFSAKHDPP